VLPNLGHATSWLGAIPANTLVVFIVTIGALVAFARFAPRFPGALVVVAATIVVSSALDLGAHGVATIGAFAAGLPRLALPGVSMERVDLLGTCAVSVFVVAIAKSLAVARSFANKHHQRSDTNGNLTGLAAANLAAAVSGTFVVSGSATKTEMVDAAGGRSQNNDRSGRAFHCRSSERFAGAYGGDRERSLPRGNFESRRGRKELATQELPG
jgi:MFS superfamily sulfate permease-like transporter